MTQEELEHLLHARAGPRGPLNVFQFTEETQTVDQEVPGPFAGSEPVKRKVQVPVRTWTDPGTGQVVKVQVNPDGTYTKLYDGIDPKAKGEPATTPAQQQTAAGASQRVPVTGHPGIYTVKTTKQQADGSMAEETHFENEAGQTVPTPTEAGKTSRQPETIGGKAYDKVTTVTTRPDGGSDTETHYEDPAHPGVKIPTPLAAPTTLGVPAGSITKQDAQGNTTKVTTYLKPDGTTQDIVDTASVAKNTEIEKDPATGRSYEIIRNPDGSVKGKREIAQPASSAPTYTYPEVKLAYGNISQELMAVSKDIYSRVGTGPGKITKEEADRLFKPIYDQAQVRVSELNSIVSTQKSVWESQLSTANQRLDAATRMAGQAMGMAKDANLMAPGTGAVAGQMVWDMMNAQKEFAGGMGGLTDVKPPGYLGAAMGMGPDSPAPATPPSGFAPLPGAPAAGPAGGPNALGLGAIGAVGAPGAPGSGPEVPPPSGAEVAAANAASQAQSQAAFAGLGLPSGAPTAGTPGGPPLAPGPVWQPPGAPPGAPPAGPAGGLDPGFSVGPPGGGQAQDPGFSQGPPGGGAAMDPGFTTGGPQGMASPGGGITITIGGQPQQPGAPPAQANYLQPALQPQRPSLHDVQRGLAGDLLGAGFDEDVLEHVWSKKTGQSLLGRGGMAAGGFG